MPTSSRLRVELLESRKLLFAPIGMAGDVMPDIDDQVIASEISQFVAAGERLEFTELRVDGELVVAGELYGQTLFVAPGGRLELLPGAVVTIADVPIDTLEDPHQIGNGILVAGELDINGTEKTAFAQLSLEASKGDSTLVFADVPDDWHVGDTLAIADTRQLQNSDLTYQFNINSVDPMYVLRPIGGYQHETLVIASINGNSISVAEPVRFDHLGLQGNFPHVANLTRDVVLRSENPLGTRGHLIGFHGATMSIVGAEVDGFGRTSVDILDSGVVKGDEVLHVGSNQVGRYAIHFHHLGTSGTSEIRGTAINGSPKWGIGIHGTHYIDIDNNAVWQAEGAGIVAEDGNETGLVITGNYTGASNGSGEDIDGRLRTPAEFAFEGSGIWLHGASDTTVRGNVSEGNAVSQYAVFQLPAGSIQTKQLKIPKFVGADLNNPAHYSAITQNRLSSQLSFREFSSNIAAGGRRGFDFWSLDKPNTFENLTSWNTSSVAFVYFYSPLAPIIVDSTFLADPSKSEGSIGFSHQGEINRGDFDLTRVRISGFSTGALLRPAGATLRSQIIDSIFENNALDVQILNGQGVNDSETEITGTLNKVRLTWETRDLWAFQRGDRLQKIVINGIDAYFDAQESASVVPNNKLFDFPGKGVTNADLIAWGRLPTLGRSTPPDAFRVAWLVGGKVSTNDSYPQQIAQLTYQSFSRLKPADLKFLLPEQIASIPSSEWFKAIPAVTRGAFDSRLLRELTFMNGLLPLLTDDQIGLLSDDQIARTPFADLHRLSSAQIAKIPADRFSSIASVNDWNRIPQTVRDSLSMQQIQAIPLYRGIISSLQVTQRSWLTSDQIRSISYPEFAYIAQNQVQYIAPEKVGAIPDAYQLYLIPTHVRQSFTQQQVEQLKVNVEGMLRFLSPAQREWLTPAQIQSLSYRDFEYISANSVQYITAQQARTIPDPYQLYRIPTNVRQAFTRQQVEQLKVNVEGMIRFLSPAQRKWLTEAQVRSLKQSDFQYLTAQQATLLTDAQYRSIPDLYWWNTSFSAGTIGALRQLGIQWLYGRVVINR